MSGIAEVLLNLGYRVSGSDLNRSETVARLEGIGGKIHIGHRPEHIGGAQVVVVSSAVAKTNPEVRAAEERKVPVIPRAEMLAELMRLKYGVAIAGAHGKTTTTSMVASVLAEGGLDPTAVIGGKLNAFGSHAKLGKSDLLVAEADESDGSLLKLSPTIAVVTTIDREHLDFYGNLEKIKAAFIEFLNKVPFYGLSILCLDQEAIQGMIPRLQKRVLTYGMNTQADLIGQHVVQNGWETRFEVRYQEKSLGEFQIPLPGLHNVYNALASIGVAIELEVDLERVRRGLSEFTGVERRFQRVGEKNKIMVVDDYGHHPTEIKATLSAARAGWGRRVVVAFQPHRYSRTRDLMEEFSTAFYEADGVFVIPIYPAGEDPIPGVSGEGLAEELKKHGHREVFFCPTQDALVERLSHYVRPGDVVLTLGAGDIWKAGKALLENL